MNIKLGRLYLIPVYTSFGYCYPYLRKTHTSNNKVQCAFPRLMSVCSSFWYTDTARKVSKYGVIFGLYFAAFGPNTERYFVSLRIQSECGKIWTRNISVFGYFSRSVSIMSCIGLFNINFPAAFINKSLTYFQHYLSLFSFLKYLLILQFMLDIIYL